MIHFRRLDCIVFLPSLRVGGTEKVATFIAEFLARENCVGLATFDREQNDKLPVQPGITRIGLDELSDSRSVRQAITSNIRRIYKIRSMLKAQGPKVLIAFLPQSNVLALIASIGLDVKVIVSERNSIRNQNLNGVWRWLRRVLYRSADNVVTNSQEIERELVAEVGCKVNLIPNPVACAEESKSIRGTNKILLTVGRLVYQKGFDILIEGFSISQCRTHGWKLYVVGEGPEREQIEKRIKDLSLEKEVVLVGMTLDTRSWYEKADLFILTSRYEGMPNAMLEAMSNGLPVIMSSKSGGGNELIEDGVTGFVVEPTPIDIAKILDRVVENPKMSLKVGQAGRQCVKKFDYETVGALWKTLIEED